MKKPTKEQQAEYELYCEACREIEQEPLSWEEYLEFSALSS